MGALLRFSWELQRSWVAGSNPSPVFKEREDFANLSPQRCRWAKKSVEGYIRQQERKWQRWDEALFKAK